MWEGLSKVVSAKMLCKLQGAKHRYRTYSKMCTFSKMETMEDNMCVHGNLLSSQSWDFTLFSLVFDGGLGRAARKRQLRGKTWEWEPKDGRVGYVLRMARRKRNVNWSSKGRQREGRHDKRRRSSV